MITTLTLNPSIDRRYSVENFEKDKVFRCSDYQKTPGGKGLNVARVIKNLGEEVNTTGFLGGRNGEFIEEELNKLEIYNSFAKINEETRNCIAILSNDGTQTEILESGPEISKQEIETFEKKFEEIIQNSKIICASGSLPKKVPVDTYKSLIIKAKESGVKFILDTSGQALIEGIKASPYLIKPNKEEMEAITGQKIETEDDLIKCAVKIQQSGVENVIVSLGKYGSILVNDEGIFKAIIPKVQAVNPVGSGDSMVAGLAVALKRGYSPEKMLAFASACGTANAMENETGKVDLEILESILEKVVINS